MRKLVILFYFLFTSSVVLSQIKDSLPNASKFQNYATKSGEIYTYKKPRFIEMITNIPRNVYGTVNDFGYKENLIALGGATIMTVAIIPEDQELLNQSRIFGERIGLKDFAKYNDFGPLRNIPSDLTSAIYLIGNGTTPLLMSMGFATFGLIKKDYRALNTSTGLVESLLVCGVFSQTIKRISGRQSPAPAIIDGNPGGDWNPFPSFSAYGKNTPNYDAMPSGHVMTATAALNVILSNYPDKKWIKPLGYSLIGLLGFEMVQANVHWYSDYPIALVMGYIIGKNVANSKIKKTNSTIDVSKKFTFNVNASRSFGYNFIGTNITF
ncbi:MAG: phosphatase PAP2 family protein [Flavobacterium sp.]|nr:phosphatase PAP2 family protein [Flavobacterium sp.]